MAENGQDNNFERGGDVKKKDFTEQSVSNKTEIQRFHDRLIGNDRVISRKLDEFSDWILVNHNTAASIDRFNGYPEPEMIRIYIKTPLLNRTKYKDAFYNHITCLFADQTNEDVDINDIRCTDTGLIEASCFYVVLK